MRKFLIFALVLGLGAALLWYFETERRKDNARGPDVRVVDRDRPVPTPIPDGPEVDDGAGGGAGGGAPNGTEPGGKDGGRSKRLDGERVLMTGGQKHTRMPTRPDEPRVVLVATDSRPLDESGSKIELIDLVVDSFEVDGSPRDKEPKRNSIVAETAQIEVDADEFTSKFNEDLTARLYGVVVEQFRGLPIAPVTIEAPQLDAENAFEEFRSIGDDLVTFKSPDVRGSGRGLVALTSAESLAFDRGADVSIELGDGRQVRIATTGGGPLSIVDETPPEDVAAGAPRLVRVRARDGVQVRLQPSGASDGPDDPEDPDEPETPLTVDATSIDILLAIVDGADRPLVRSARADGEVTIRQGRDVYVGDTARIFFEGSEPSRVVLEQDPRATYVVREPDGRELTLEVTGVGPVTGYLLGDPAAAEDGAPVASRLRFVFAGPGRIEAIDRGGVVTFENEARGQGLEDRSEATVLVSGEVHVEANDGTLESESLLVTYVADEALRFASEGPTRIVARSADTGEEYRARAGGGLTAHLEGESWFVDHAEDFHAETLGEDPHRLDAESVSNVDIDARTLSARGNIRYQSLWGEVRSADALVRGERSIELTGTEEVPVVLDVVPEGEALMAEAVEIAGIRTGSVRAVRLTLDETSFRAEGRVDAQLETPEGVWGFDSDTLRARRAIVSTPNGNGAPIEAGASRRSDELHVEADFVRQARFDTLDGRATFSATRIVLDGVVLGAVREERKPTELDPDREVTVRAIGEVDALLESLGPDGAVVASWALDANSAFLTRGQRDVEQDGRAPFNLTADQVTECRYEAAGRFAQIAAKNIEIDGMLGSDGLPRVGGEDGEVNLRGSSLVATGDVDATYRGGPNEPEVRGRGHTLILLDGERGRLAEEPGKRVRATGTLPGEPQPYTMTAKVVNFTRTELRAEIPELDFPTPVPVEQLGGLAVKNLRGDLLVVTEKTITMTGRVRGTGLMPTGAEIGIEYEEVKIPRSGVEFPRKTIGPYEPVPQETQDDEPSVVLRGGRITLGEDTWVDGNVTYPDGRIRVEGTPAHFESKGRSLDAEFISIDVENYLLDAGRGAIRLPGPRDGEVATLEFASIESTLLDDEILVVIAAPRVVSGADSARADYIAFWIDRARWKAKGDSLVLKKPMPESFPNDDQVAAARQQPNFLAELLFDLQSQEYGGYLRAVYLEGGFEIVRADRRSATGSKLYIDLPRAVAWMQDPELVYPLLSSGREVPLRVRTDRLETDEEGRLVALGATLTTCDHEEPHFVVRTREFALEPRGDGRWRFGARGNRIKFQGGIAMPLPSIGNVVLDEDFGVEGFENEAGEVTPLRDIGVAQTARFGAVLGAAFRFDVGNFGSWIAEGIGMDTSKVRGKWDTEAQYLWDRGPLLGAGLQLREREPGDNPDEDFRFDSFVGGIPDDGMDRGTVRVDEADRDTLRLWGYGRSRYPIVEGEWVDIAVASQTDAGVQSEFYENEYQRFEQRDTFVRWRKSYGADYLTAGAQKRIDDFRSQKEELPSFFAYRGERSVGTLTGIPVYWGGSFEAGYFTRREGDPQQDLFSDLPGGAQLGIGDAEAGRADLVQRVSFPIRTDIGAIKATPFAEFRGTAWTDSLDGGDDPARGAAITGLELSTTLHKVTDNGYLHALAPRISASTDVWYDENGGELIPFDRTEQPIDGITYEAGLRALWQRPATFEALDVDLRAILRQDRESGIPDSSEVGTLARYVTRYGSGQGQIGFFLDARYDIENSQTTYGRSAFAVRPNDVFLVELRYSQARDLFQEELFETGGVVTRWTIDPKWELEAGYVQDLRNDDQLLTEFTLRRFSHDFVLDISFQDRAGEGGTNISFSFAPLLGWTRSRMGMLDRR